MTNVNTASEVAVENTNELLGFPAGDLQSELDELSRLEEAQEIRGDSQVVTWFSALPTCCF